MSHTQCLIPGRMATDAYPTPRWADMVDEERSYPTPVPLTPPDEYPTLPGGGRVSSQYPTVSETTETWYPTTSLVETTVPNSVPDYEPYSTIHKRERGPRTLITNLQLSSVVCPRKREAACLGWAEPET